MAGYGEAKDLEFYPLVKAAPVITAGLDESMCVAGIEWSQWSGNSGNWVRVFPVAFRDLEESDRFRKYEQIRMSVRRDTMDYRAESWRPRGGEVMRLAEPLSTNNAWSDRRDLIESVTFPTMCELIRENDGGHGEGARSLAAVRTLNIPTLTIEERSQEQIRLWQQRAAAVAATPSLFDDPDRPKRPLEVIPWRFLYHYRCLEPGCRGHDQTIVDWEILAYYLRIKNSPAWRTKMQQRWVDDLWMDRDSLIFVGNQHKRPQGFLVLGVFWPPNREFTPSLWSA